MPERVRIMEYAEIQQSTPEKEAPVNGQVSFPLKSEFLLTRCHRRVRVYLCDSLRFLYFYVVFSLLRLLKKMCIRDRNTVVDERVVFQVLQRINIDDLLD